MKAFLIREYGDYTKGKIEELSSTPINPDEIKIKVAYAGVNFPDLLITKGLYQFKPDLPFTPGGELSGVVLETGSEVTQFKKGDRVMAANSWGAFAEEVVLPQKNCFQLPDIISLKTGAVILESYATTLHALKDRGTLSKGERLLVLGAAGGTGTAAVQLGKLMGAEVVAAASTEEKLKFCKSNGADHLINSTTTDIREFLKEIGGVDVIYDPVGGDLSEKSFRSIRPNGRHLVVGFASGVIPAMPWNLPLLKSAAIVGVFWGGFWRTFHEQNTENVKQLLDWIASRKLDPPVTHVYEFSEITEALQAVDTKMVMGKVAIKIGG